MTRAGRRVVRAACLGVGVGVGCLLAMRGSLTLDVGIGRRIRSLGPIRVPIGATRETVFDVIAAPYLAKTPRAMADKLHVLERGTDMVLAAHFTPTPLGKATTVETVRFERPKLVSFRLLRGPVPHVTETFELGPTTDGTQLLYRGELGTDLWFIGAWWGDAVARIWEQTVQQSLDRIREEAERRAGA
jgi:Polyketide cyclase / dehydrase and lipid transport